MTLFPISRKLCLDSAGMNVAACRLGSCDIGSCDISLKIKCPISKSVVESPQSEIRHMIGLVM